MIHWLKPYKDIFVRPVSKTSRVGCWFILACAVFAISGTIFFGLVVENDLRIIVPVLFMSSMAHFFGTIAVTGFIPRYAKFLHKI